MPERRLERTRKAYEKPTFEDFMVAIKEWGERNGRTWGLLAKYPNGAIRYGWLDKPSEPVEDDDWGWS